MADTTSKNSLKTKVETAFADVLNTSSSKLTTTLNQTGDDLLAEAYFYVLQGDDAVMLRDTIIADLDAILDTAIGTLSSFKREGGTLGTEAVFDYPEILIETGLSKDKLEQAVDSIAAVDGASLVRPVLAFFATLLGLFLQVA